MKRFWQLLFSLLFVGIGIIIGLVIGNIPYLTFKSEVGFGDVTNFILALILAIFIPISLSKWLDNNRRIKDFLIDDVKDCLSCLDTIKKKIDSCYIEKKTIQKDTRELLALIRTLDMGVFSLMSQLQASFRRKSSKLMDQISNENLYYWKETTGGGFGGQNFKIDDFFCIQQNKAYMRYEIFLKKSIRDINQF